MADVIYTLAALGIIAVGWLTSWELTRSARKATRRPPPVTPLRHRQIDREVDDSHPIGWRR